MGPLVRVELAFGGHALTIERVQWEEAATYQRTPLDYCSPEVGEKQYH